LFDDPAKLKLFLEYKDQIQLCVEIKDQILIAQKVSVIEIVRHRAWEVLYETSWCEAWEVLELGYFWQDTKTVVDFFQSRCQSIEFKVCGKMLQSDAIDVV